MHSLFAVFRSTTFLAARIVSRAESVFRQRNIACHMPAILQDGRWTLTPVAAAKVLKHFDLDKPGAKFFPIADLKTAIATGEAALAEGVGLVENFKRLNAELDRRRAAVATEQVVAEQLPAEDAESAKDGRADVRSTN